MKDTYVRFHLFLHLYTIQHAYLFGCYLTSLSHLCFHKLSCSLGHNCHSGKLHGSLDTVTLSTHFQIGIKSMHRMPLFQNSKFSEKIPSAFLDEDVKFFYFICFHQDRILSWGEHWNSKWRKTSTWNLSFKYKTTLTQKAPITNEPNTSHPPKPETKKSLYMGVGL